MKYTPAWKDIDLTLGTNAIDFTIKKDGEWLHSGRAVAYPSENVAKLNINHFFEEDLNPEFGSDIREADDDVVTNPDAYGEFEVRDENDGLLEKYCVLYDWSYEDNWTGQTKYIMTNPINGHLDPRMRLMCSMFNTSETSIRYTIGNYINVFPNTLRFTTADRESGATKSVSVVSNDSWTASISGYSGFSLTNVSSGGFNVTLASGAVPSGAESATVTVVSGTRSVTVSVLLASFITVTPKTSDNGYSGSGNGYTVQVKADCDWHQWASGTDSGTTESNNPYGLVFTPSSGTSGYTTVVITAPLNTGATSAEASCTIVATEDGTDHYLTNEFSVGYHPHYTASTSSVTLTSAGTAVRVDVNTNTSISAVTTSADWLTIYDINPTYFYVSASTNNKAVTKEADVTIALNLTTFTAGTKVYQAGKSIVAGSNIINYKSSSKVNLTIEPYTTYGFGAEVYSHTYDPITQEGVITCDDTITQIGYGAFSGNTGLESVTIPSEVTVLYNYAFSGCTNLIRIDAYPSSTPNVANQTFYGVASNGELHTTTPMDYRYGTTWLNKFNNWTIVSDLQ